MIRIIPLCLVMFSTTVGAWGQQSAPNTTEQVVALSEHAVALDSQGVAALEGTLRTTSLNGTANSPVTNIRMVIKNVSALQYGYVSGVVTFYDSSTVRCGEGLFKADVLLTGESVETDTPGIRIRCSPTSWRMVATNLVPRMPPGPAIIESTAIRLNFLISIDGEEHPIQLDRPMVLNIGERRRTIVVRQSP